MSSFSSYKEFQTSLYYFGFLSSIAFGLRFLVQWILSEKEKKSVVPKAFWILSFTGNMLLFIHCFIQQYFPMYFLQSLHMPLALRNMNLMTEKPYPLKRFLFLLPVCATLSLLLYLSQYVFLPQGDFCWIRTRSEALVSHPLIHLIGILGVGAFSLRFWIQWWESETERKSVLKTPFWLISLCGSLLATTYFFLMQDWVNIVGPVIAIIPYTRNLCLIRKTKEQHVDIVVIAMETSGDLLGGKIVAALKKENPSFTFAGVVGPEMKKESVQEWANIKSYQAMGLIDVVKKLPRFTRLLYRLAKKINEATPSHIIFLDSPSFGLRLTSLLKKKKIPGKTIQIVAPSIWAWGKEKRLKALRQSIDLLVPLFAFEQELFETHLKTKWFGHPLFDKSFFTHQRPKSKTPLLALFPGSRPGEIGRNLPLQIKTAALLQQKLPFLEIGLVLADSLPQNVQEQIKQTLKKSPLTNYHFVPFSQRYLLMESAWVALAKCGTTILELFLKETPTAVCYNLGKVERSWAKHFLKVAIPFYSLPNILSKEMVVQEFIHPEPTAEEIASFLLPFLQELRGINRKAYEKVYAQVVSGQTTEEAIARYIVCEN